MTRKLGERLHDLSGVIDRRIQTEERTGPQIVLVGIGLQRARALRESEPTYRFSDQQEEQAPHPNDLFLKILADGPEVGVHTIGWWDGLTSLNRAVRRQGREHFGIRAALALSADESSQLLDSPAAAKLGGLRGLLWDENRPSDLEKFIPYSLRDVDWRSWVGSELSRKWERR